MVKNWSDLQQEIYDSIQFDDQFKEDDQIKNELTIRELRIVDAIKLCTAELGKSRARLLDVGCGTCKISRNLNKECDLYGIEISKSLAAIAARKGVKVSLMNIETEKYPFDDEYFDIVFSGEVIEHIIDSDNYLFEINRVLKKGGYFVISFPNINQPISWLAMILFDFPPVFSSRYKSAHVRDYTLRIIKKVLELYGFEILGVRGSYVYPFTNILSQKLAHIIPRLSEQIIITSRKRANACKDYRVVIRDTRDI